MSDFSDHICLVDNGTTHDRIEIGPWPFCGGRVAVHTNVMGDAVAFSATDRVRGREHMIARRTMTGWDLLSGPDGRAMRLPSVEAATKATYQRLLGFVERLLAHPDRFEVDPSTRFKEHRSSNAAYVTNKDPLIFYTFTVHRRAWGQDGNDIVAVEVRLPADESGRPRPSVMWGLEVPPIIQPVERPLMVKF